MAMAQPAWAVPRETAFGANPPLSAKEFNLVASTSAIVEKISSRVFVFNENITFVQDYTLIMSTRTFCLECNSQLLGRADKKFCNDFCRNNYNNRLKSQEMACLKKVNLILAKNRKILLGFLEQNVNKINRKVLEEKGFNFDYFTQIIQNRKGMKYYFVYESGYLPLENNWYYLCRKRAPELGG